MKKILLLTSVSLLSFSALAGAKTSVEDVSNGFYLKGHAGATKLNNVSNDIIRTSSKHKSKVSPVVGVGIGYKINDIVRTDLTFDYMTTTFTKGSGIQATPMPAWVTTNGGQILSFKTHIHNIMVNGYVDVFQVQNLNVFVGGGVGYARINEDQLFAIGQVTGSGSTPASHNFAYAAHAGVDMKLTDNTKVELMYSWKNHGKSKSNKTNSSYNNGINTYKGSHATVGMRFDI